MKAVVFIFPLASFKKSKIILLFLYVTASHAYRALGGQSVLLPWDWSYRRLQITIWVLGMEPRSSPRALSAQCSYLSSFQFLAPSAPFL